MGRAASSRWLHARQGGVAELGAGVIDELPRLGGVITVS
jgi:hypothetical protein